MLAALLPRTIRTHVRPLPRPNRFVSAIAVPLALVGTGCTPPRLDVVHPLGMHTGMLRVDVTTDGTELHWRADQQGFQPVENGLIEVDTRSWPDGPHTIEVRARSWGGWSEAHQSFEITTDNTGPAVALAERSFRVEQGHTLPIVFRVDEPITHLRVVAFDKERTAFELEPGLWRALVGVPIRQEPGHVKVSIEVDDERGNRAFYRPEVLVSEVDWPTSGKLPLSKNRAAVDPPAMVEMRQERDAVYATLEPLQQWDGLFGMPVYKGQHTSAFGTYREYPDGTRSHHDAEDIARRRGVYIYAANDGTVALAKMQEVHGNAVLIQHGQKVVSLYSHLQELDVEPGQEVTKGDILGRMGSTGRSTGPHLHWGIVVDEVPVDPMQWVDTAFDAESFEEFTDLVAVRALPTAD
jgi:hypothetical protein